MIKTQQTLQFLYNLRWVFSFQTSTPIYEATICHSPKSIIWVVVYIREHCSLTPLPAVLQCYVLVISIQTSESPHIFCAFRTRHGNGIRCSSIHCSYSTLTSRFQFTHCVQREEQTVAEEESTLPLSVNRHEPDKYQACFSPPTSTLSTGGNAAGMETRLRAGRAGVESR